MSFAGKQSAPWQDDPLPKMPPVPIRVTWDYKVEAIVGNGMSTFFDSHWTYIYYGPGEALQWGLSRYPGEHMFVAERVVPEIIKLAVMVIE